MSVAYSLQRSPIGFPSLWSRFLLQRGFNRQLLTPGSSPRLARWFLTFVDRCLFQVDTRGLEVRKPIFLLGLDRTARTMLGDLLCKLPEISYVTQRMNLHPTNICAVEAIARWLRPDGRGERYLRDEVELAGSSPDEGDALWQRWLGEDAGDFRDFPSERREAMVNDLRKILWCFWPRGGRFFSNNPCLLPHAPLLGRLFPDAHFIHVLRDPRQTAPEMAPLWRDTVARLDEVKNQLPSYLEVRFEDILANPRAGLERILYFCKLDASVQQTEFWTRFSSGDKLRTRSDDDNSRFVEQICGDVMHQHGYRER